MIEILINGQRVFSGNVNVNVNKSIYEILEPDRRQSDLTKTIDIIGTPESDKVFMAAFDVNFQVGSATFDPSIKTDAVIYAETNEVIRGYCQLTDVIITDENNHVYKLVIYGQLSDLFSKIENKKLQELDFSDLDHTWNITNVQSNWSGSFGDGYQYPYVMWAAPTFPQNPFNTELIEWRPFLYVFEIFTRVMQFTGVRWQSTFINSLAFKKLIYRGDVPMKRTETQIADSLVNVARATTAFELNGTNTATIFGGLTIELNSVISDPSSQWDNTFYAANIDKSGKYNFQGLIDITFKNSNFATRRPRILDLEVVVERSSVVVQRMPIRLQTSTLTQNQNVVKQFAFNDVVLQSGDVVYLNYVNAMADNPLIGWQNFYNSTLWTGSTIDINIGTQMSFRLTEQLTEGDTIDVARMVAGTQTISDFLMGLVKMFNLFIEYQPDGSVLIEPYHNFYTNEIEDLTPYLAVDREFIIKPLEQSKYKFYQYKYKNGNNKLAKAHREGYGEEFGQTIIQVDNYFSKGVKSVDVPFKLLINANNAVEILANVSPYPLCSNENNNGQWVGDGLPIIAYYGGMVTSSQNMTIVNSTGIFTLINQYPFAGYIDHPDTPNFDLCFDLPSAVYYQREDIAGISIIEDGQLYPQYHEDYIEELTNRNSKIIECYIKMDSYLYNQMTFRKFYFIRNAYYRLYQIENFNPQTNEPTKCIFLKVVKYVRKVPSNQEDWSDVTDGGGGGNSERTVGGGLTVGDNEIIGGSLVVGENNSVEIENGVILGFNNQVGILPNTINVNFNQVFNSEDEWEYDFYGIEGSPFYIRNEGEFAEITLHAGVRNSGKQVNISSTEDFDLRLTADGSLVAYSAGYHIFINFNGNWIKVQ